MTKPQKLQAPFPYFGGKSAIAGDVWLALGQPEHYLEPFCGSSAVLLARPKFDELPLNYNETINDIDGHIANIWRALKYNPEKTAEYADDIICHVDLYAKKKFINENYPNLLELLKESPEAHDPRMAGYYIWAASSWIGRGLTRPNQIPHLGHSGMGINKLGVQIPHLTDTGMGVNKLGVQIPHLGHSGKGINKLSNTGIYDWFERLQARLRHVRITNGDWNIILGGNWQDSKWNTVGIFFDPPYSNKANRDKTLYNHESLDVAHDVCEYCIKHGSKPHWRIVLAGYIQEHQELLEHGWTVKQWKTSGGYANTTANETQGKNNRKLEALFFSPHCITDNKLY